VNEKLGWALAAVLVIVCAAFSFYLVHLAGQSARVPVFMPLVVDGGTSEPPPPPEGPPPLAGAIPPAESLESAGVETMTILRQAGRLGPTVSLEDFVRGLLLLEEEGGERALTPAQRKTLAPLVRHAFERRRELLAAQEKIRELEKTLPQAAAAAMGRLTAAQQSRLRATRDDVSLSRFEDPYWETLLAKWERP